MLLTLRKLLLLANEFLEKVVRNKSCWIIQTKQYNNIKCQYFLKQQNTSRSILNCSSTALAPFSLESSGTYKFYNFFCLNKRDILPYSFALLSLLVLDSLIFFSTGRLAMAFFSPPLAINFFVPLLVLPMVVSYTRIGSELILKGQGAMGTQGKQTNNAGARTNRAMRLRIFEVYENWKILLRNFRAAKIPGDFLSFSLPNTNTLNNT